MKHRGRFQAQGKNLEKSSSWSQESPLLITKGIALLDQLHKGLSTKEASARSAGFAKCRTFVLAASENGGIQISNMGKPLIKSFPKNYSERVDLEVHLGIAFIKKKEMEELIKVLPLKNFIDSPQEYSILTDFWKQAFSSFTGKLAEPYISNEFANGEDILDGNPIFSSIITTGKGIRIIQVEPDQEQTLFTAWINQTLINESDVEELVIALQLTKETYADLSRLITLFSTASLNESILLGLNEKYQS